uniref:Prenyltransferase alpha-alpha toroid domain-containing protein n=1 Tax=Chaetoceros debilis TaxID=122233 RepID=A0A7S3Q312_9STRA
MDKASPTGNESETKGPSHSASSMGETGAESEQPDPDPEIQFTRLKHIQYFANCLRGTLPKAYCKLETNRLTLVHFAVQSLEMLNFFDEPDLVERYEIRKEHIINWIYSLQVVVVQQQGSTSRNDGNAGFKGGTFLGNMSMSMNANANHLLKESCDCDTKTSSGTCSSVDTESCSGSGSGSSSSSCDKELKYDTGHLAMNYTALCTLITLGDDLERVDRRGMIQSLKQLQLPDGR